MAHAVPDAERTALRPIARDAGRPGPVPSDEPGLEVATLSADTLRASVRISGRLVPECSALLTSVFRTHICAGRRYLRVDLGQARIDDPAVVEALVTAHRAVSDLGGMVVFENAGPLVVDAIRNSTLYVNSAS